jgi:Right handed beta helix region
VVGKLVVALAVLIALLVAAPASADTLYVAPAGDDDGDCRAPASACRSFDRAYQVAALGDTVEVAAGRYESQPIFEVEGRTDEKDRPDVTFRPAQGAAVTLECWDDGSNCLAVEAHHVTVEGMRMADLKPLGGLARQGGVCICRGSYDVTFRSVDAGYLYIAGDRASVLGGDFGPITEFVSKIEYGDDGPPRDVLIDGAHFHDHRAHESHSECIAAYSGENVTIRNSTFDNCEPFGIFLSPSAGEVATGYTIENNVFTNTGGVPMSAHIKAGAEDGSDCSRLTVRFNTFIDDNVISECRGKDIRWHSNVFELGGCGEVGRFDHNVWLEGGTRCGSDTNVQVDDLGLTQDAHLTAESPAIEAGDPSDAPAADIDGELRLFGPAPDAGADERLDESAGLLPVIGWLLTRAYGT